MSKYEISKKIVKKNLGGVYKPSSNRANNPLRPILYAQNLKDKQNKISCVIRTFDNLPILTIKRQKLKCSTFFHSTVYNYEFKS